MYMYMYRYVYRYRYTSDSSQSSQSQSSHTMCRSVSFGHNSASIVLIPRILAIESQPVGLEKRSETLEA